MTLPVTETAASPAAPPAPARPAPLPSRIVDTFFEPGKVFAQLREGPAPWLGPVLVCAAVLVLLTVLRPLFISDEQMIDFMLQKAQEMGAQQPPTRDQMATQLKIQMVAGPVIGIVLMVLRVWVVGLILMAVYSLLLGGRSDVRPYAAVASHTFVVGALGYLLLGALQFATGRLDLTLDAALLAPGLNPKGMPAAVLHALTPWSVWQACLLALGGAVINRRKGWMGVAAFLLSLWLALALVFSLLGRLFMGGAATG